MKIAIFLCFSICLFFTSSVSANFVTEIEGGFGQDGWRCYCGPGNGPFQQPGDRWLFSIPGPVGMGTAIGICNRLCNRLAFSSAKPYGYETAPIFFLTASIALLGWMTRLRRAK